MISAREVAAEALEQFVKQLPHPWPMTLDVSALEPREAALATAIYRAAVQRVMTIEAILDCYLNKPLHLLEPALQGILLSAGAQILTMDRVPRHAVVDESVKLAKQRVRPGAGGVVNAVLRRFSEVVVGMTDEVWSPAADRLPCDQGSIQLAEPVLIKPTTKYANYLSVACSTPMRLIDRWLDAYGREDATALAAHGVINPPTIVIDENEQSQVWTDSHEKLRDFLAGHMARRVQDPAAALPVQSTRDLSPGVILDYCAGRGTKSRQLAAMHPQAKVYAHDIAPDRLRGLSDVPNVTTEPCAEGVDLLLLDVPCSNTGVLARRPEARYRFDMKTLESLVQTQCDIIHESIRRIFPGGHLLYATCSLEPHENQQHKKWIMKNYGAELVHESIMMPSAPGEPYHDGSYHVLFRIPKDQ